MTLFHALGPFASSGGVVAAPGMVLVSPTSITHSGTSATLGANGQVTFTAVTELNINGCFTADFDNYVISVRSVAASGNPGLQFRWRASGSDASGTDYTWQRLEATSTTVAASRSTSQNFYRAGDTSSTQRSGTSVFVYGPYLAQPTAARCVSAVGTSSALIYETAGTHSLTTSYDGFTLFASTALTGALQVYGVRS